MVSVLDIRLGRPRGYVRMIADSVVTMNLALMGVSTLGLIVTARYLGVSDRGRYLTWSSWCAMIGTLSMLGTQSFIVVAASQLDTRVSVWRLKSMLGIGVAISGVAALAAMAWLKAGALAGLGGVLLAASGPIVAVHAAVQQANGHHGWRFNAARGMPPIFGFVSVVAVLALFHTGVQGLFLGLGAGCLIGAVASVALASEPATVDPAVIPQVRHLARRGALLVLLGWLILNVDTVAVSIAGSSDNVGLYGVGAAAKSLVLALGTAVGLRWFATRDSIGSPPKVTRSFAPALALALGISMVAPVAVPFVLGNQFGPSVPEVQLLALGGVLASVDFLVSHMLLMRAGYFWPTVLRLTLVLTLVLGILAVGGEPIRSAGIFCSVMLASVAGQILLCRKGVARGDGGL